MSGHSIQTTEQPRMLKQAGYAENCRPVRTSYPHGQPGSGEEEQEEADGDYKVYKGNRTEPFYWAEKKWVIMTQDSIYRTTHLHISV